METVGSVQIVASINTKDYDAGKKHIEKGNNELESNAKKTSSGFSAAWAGAIGGVVATVAQKGFAMIAGSIDSAVKRVDTLNNSTRTFENMGIATTDSRKAMDALQKSIKGMPTPLDGAVRGMTALTATYGDIGKGQKVFSALNNAILGFGGSSAEVENAITQLSQLPMDGPLDAQTWNSLRNSGITPVLVAMAKDSGMSVSQMKEAFGSGELTVQDFTDRLVKMNTEGGGGLKSLEKIAKDSTGGVGTGFANMQTAISRGMAAIIQSIGSENISSAITAIGSGFEIVLSAISNIIGFISSTGAQFTNWVKENSVIVTNLAIIFGTLLLPQIVAFGIQSTIAFAQFIAGVVAAGVQSLVAGGRMAVAWLMALGPIGLVIAAVAGAVALIIANWEAVSSFVGGVWANITKWAGDTWNSIMSFFGGVGKWFSDIFNGAWNGIKNAFSSVGSFFRGIWDSIVSIFGNVGTAVGDAIGSAFKNVINTVLSGAVGIINGFIKAINLAIDLINNIPGVEIGKLGELQVPQFASGGFTGRGGKYEPAGIVHKGEYVIPKQYVNQSTGLPNISGGSKEYNITNNYVVNNQADAEIISRKQAYAMGAV